jgi:type 1 glutamine amidotransferase
MIMRAKFFVLALLTSIVAASCTKAPNVDHSGEDLSVVPARGEAESTSGDALRVAVVTGGHAFDVPNFYGLFRELPGVDAYPQHIEHFASSPEEVRDGYDAVVFYGMDQGIPEEEGRRAAGNPRAAIERIAAQGQGVVVLHHALLAWEKWDFWNQLIGFDNRNFRYKEGLNLQVKVSDDAHAITQGVDDFEILDEGYVLKGDYDGNGTVLLTVDHDDSMDRVAWAREYEKSRVFCMALGHDHQSWNNPGFRKVLQRGIAWSAGDEAR